MERCFKYKKEFLISVIKEQMSLLHWRHTDFNGTVNGIYDMSLRILSDIYHDEKTKIIHQISYD